MDQGKQEGANCSLEKIKKQLNRGGGNVLLQGPLLKRSETLRKWNQRWFTLDTSTGKMEYKSQRGDSFSRGVVPLDADSTITVSPINIMKDQKYDGCCFYIGTSQKKEFFFCAETPSNARAWVATLRAAGLVLKAHREAVNSLNGTGQSTVGAVAAVVAAANATAREATKDLQLSVKAAAAASLLKQKSAGAMDNIVLMKETLRVKDEELHQLVRDLRARDVTMKELADHLTVTAHAAESAASAVHAVDKEHKEALLEVDRSCTQLLQVVQEIRGADARAAAALKAEEAALLEAHRWRLELGKVRERGVILEAAIMRTEEEVRQFKLAQEFELAKRLQAQQARIEDSSLLETCILGSAVAEEAASQTLTTDPCTIEGSEADTGTMAANISDSSSRKIPEGTSSNTHDENMSRQARSASTGLLQDVTISGPEKSIQSGGFPDDNPIQNESLSQPYHVPFHSAVENRVMHETADSEVSSVAGEKQIEHFDHFSAPFPAEDTESGKRKTSEGLCDLSMSRNGENNEEAKETSVIRGEKEMGEGFQEVTEVLSGSHELVTDPAPSRQERLVIEHEHHDREGTTIQASSQTYQDKLHHSDFAVSED